jgi:hypothetical protein
LHREWMIRAFAIGLAVATQRVIFIPALFAVADPTEGPVATLSAVSFLAAFAVHVSVAEAWIRLTRRSGVARTLAAKAAGAKKIFVGAWSWERLRVTVAGRCPWLSNGLSSVPACR